MKVEVEEKIEVTMVMTLREAKVIRVALAQPGTPDRGQLYREIDTALKGQEKKA